MTRILIGLVLTLAVAAGCDQYCRQSGATTEPPGVNTWMVQTINDAAVENAIIRQQAIYPYHFVVNGADLNGLGQADLAVLAAHYRQYPGKLSVRQGQADKAAYDARVATVMKALKDAGVETKKVNVTDAVAGGDGLPSREVLLIIEQTSGQGPRSAVNGIYRPVVTTGVQP